MILISILYIIISKIHYFSNKIAINIIKQATKKLISGPEADIL